MAIEYELLSSENKESGEYYTVRFFDGDTDIYLLTKTFRFEDNQDYLDNRVARLNKAIDNIQNKLDEIYVDGFEMLARLDQFFITNNNTELTQAQYLNHRDSVISKVWEV